MFLPVNLPHGEDKRTIFPLFLIPDNGIQHHVHKVLQLTFFFRFHTINQNSGLTLSITIKFGKSYSMRVEV